MTEASETARAPATAQLAPEVPAGAQPAQVTAASPQPPVAPVPYWPGELRRLWVTLSEVPLVFLGTAAAAIGVFSLNVYFNSQGFTPSDFGVLLGSAAVAGALVLALFFAIGLGVFGPAVIEHQFPKGAVGPQAMKGALVLGLGGIFFYFVRRAATNCPGPTEPSLNWLRGFLVLLLLGGLALVLEACWHRRKEAKLLGESQWRAVATCIVCTIALAFISTVMILPLIVAATEISAQVESFPVSDVLFVLIATVAAALNVAMLKIPRIWGRVVASVCVIVVVYPLFGFLGAGAAIPRAMAATMGMIIPGTSTLIVTERTCQLLRAAVLEQGESGSSAPPKCAAGFNQARADVLVRSSGHWFVQLRELAGTPVQPVRMTIPERDIEIVKSVPPRRLGESEKTAC